MIKADLVNTVNEKSNIAKNKAKKCVDVIFEEIKKALKYNDYVKIKGFGSFVVVKRAKKMGRNPITGESIRIPARKVVKFKPGKDLKF